MLVTSNLCFLRSTNHVAWWRHSFAADLFQYKAPKKDHNISSAAGVVNKKATIRVKMKTSSELKLQRKQDRKTRRKDYRLQQRASQRAEELDSSSAAAQNEALSIIDSVENAQNLAVNTTTTTNENIVPPRFDHSPVMILKRDQEDDEYMITSVGDAFLFVSTIRARVLICMYMCTCVERV